MMKFAALLILALASLVNSATLVEDNSHDLTLGTVSDDDWILWNREVKVKGSWLPWKTVTSMFNYTIPQDASPAVITAIRAFDKSPLGKGGYPKLVSGGTGSDHVSIEFSSQNWWKGLDFLVVIYGRV